MTKSALDGILELVVALAAGVGSLVLTALGVLAEQAGLQNLALGHVTIGAWETAIGTVILFVGVYLLGYDQFWRRIQRLLLA